jgi:hypothetical protein
MLAEEIFEQLRPGRCADQARRAFDSLR